MICPYNSKSEVQIQTWQQHANEETQILTNGKTITQTAFEPMECQKEKCGAWYNDRYHYKD
ncbi:MAG: hypothetical protein ACLS5A_03970 [Pseudoruminococcus massiliensis]